MVTKEEVLELIKTVGLSNLDDISNAFSIPKFGSGSAYEIVKLMLADNLIVRDGTSYKLPSECSNSEVNSSHPLITHMDDYSLASVPMRKKITDTAKLEKLIIKPDSISIPAKELIGLKTGTFIDDLYLKPDRTSLGGIPAVAQILLAGMPGSGKSILAEEIAIRVSNDGKKVLYVTSEDMWKSSGDRFDLQSRCRQKADILKLEWNRIESNLYIIDTVENEELQEWTRFAEMYRYVIDTKNIDLVIIDSATALETYRGALKYRVMELAKYNQRSNVTGIFISQRSDESWDSFAIAGGIGMGHILDSTILLDYGRPYYQDQIAQLGARGEFTRMLRIMDCRLCNFIRTRIKVDITEDGFVRPLA